MTGNIFQLDLFNVNIFYLFFLQFYFNEKVRFLWVFWVKDQEDKQQRNVFFSLSSLPWDIWGDRLLSCLCVYSLVFSVYVASFKGFCKVGIVELRG